MKRMDKPCRSRADVLARMLIGAWCLLVSVAPAWAQERPSLVKLVKNGEGYALLRNGQPYFIKGAGGDGSKQMLAEAGGNSIRTWGADNLGPLLDEAQKRGLTVTVGIWLGHEEQGFNYNDADQVAKQYEAAQQAILKYKDHPAVLMWAIGNEMEGYGKGDNAAIWSAINNIATLAKRLDPYHPTMTVLAEIGGDKVKNVHRLCPDIDIVGINSYGGAPSLPARYKQAGGAKPYILTEFGPPGVWEVGKTAWGAAPEPTSTEKAEFYRRAYQQAVLAPRGLCLGSYAFTWGNKQEATATWFGLLLPDGSRLGGVDALTELWSGKPPANRCPLMQSLKLQGADQVEPGALVKATLAASDPDGDPLTVRWVLQRD
ncbi:MAG TPA: glycoside hydrolase family 2 TIM barrel-domain containing protein, partial [Chthonomonadaceae bacterium]|nr:glycoside hydrolase family 2 TIM barrel-domain containing protein [Chthonomonadaceae bacterium]